MYKKMSDNQLINGYENAHKINTKDKKIDNQIPQQLNFLTPKEITVLNFFLADPMGEYYEREVARKTGVSRGSAHGILLALAKVDFLTREEKGRMLIYKLNLNEPTVKQLKITVNTFALKKLVNNLKHDSRKIMLFGSCAQGTDTKESDIDLLIITNEKEQVRKIINVFGRKQQRQLAPIIVDMTEFIKLKKEDKSLYENIERGVVLWEAE
jgi:predicted nucleotidyltransferase